MIMGLSLSKIEAAKNKCGEMPLPHKPITHQITFLDGSQTPCHVIDKWTTKDKIVFSVEDVAFCVTPDGIKSLISVTENVH